MKHRPLLLLCTVGLALSLFSFAGESRAEAVTLTQPLKVEQAPFSNESPKVRDAMFLVYGGSYSPIFLQDRVFFYAAKVYKSNPNFEDGSRVLLFITTICESDVSRYVITEIMVPSRGTYTVFASAVDLMKELMAQPYKKLDADLQPIATVVCEARTK